MATLVPRTEGWNRALSAFPESARPEIDRIWENHGCLPAESVARLAVTVANIGTLMMQLLPFAQQYAVVPVSNYQVGAVAAGMPIPGTGWCSLYLGANFEFPNSALSFTVHAEQCATNNAWLSGQPGIQALAISAAPCGYCRQFLYELVTAKDLNILLPNNPKNPLSYSLTPLTTFLPNAFGPKDLNVDGGLMDPKLCTHTLVLNNPSTDPVIVAALAAACGSYAPYLTPSPKVPPQPPPYCGPYGYAGIALQLADGSIHPGRNAENAAYNPSLSPLESALSFANMNLPSPGTLPAVTRCVLVELQTMSTQLSATQAVLSACAPTVTVEYCQAALV